MTVLEKSWVALAIAFAVIFAGVLPLLGRFGDRDRLISLVQSDWFWVISSTGVTVLVIAAAVFSASTVYRLVSGRLRTARKARQIRDALVTSPDNTAK